MFVSESSEDFIPNGSKFANEEITPLSKRSPEETEAAHDLLSLSQSLPPLTAPSVVVIHHTIPSEDDPPSPSHCYRPLSPENTKNIPNTHSYSSPSLEDSSRLGSSSKIVPKKPVPILPAPEPVILQTAPIMTTQPVVAPPHVVVPCYAQPIVYVVQVPGAMPTPPTSDCNSDVENVQLCTVERLGQPMGVDPEKDIIILPLSPEPDLNENLSVKDNMATISLPDRRKKKNKRKKIINNNNEHSVEDVDCDVEILPVTSAASKTVSLFHNLYSGAC